MRERPMFEKVAFTMLPVKDMKRARAFYENTLGLAVGSRSSNGIWTEYDLPGGGCVALFATQSAEPGGGGSLAFEVADLDALIAQLDRKGIYFEARMVHSPVCRMSILKDSEGNSLILHELGGKRRIASPRPKAKPKAPDAHAPVAAPRAKMPTLDEQPRTRSKKPKPGTRLTTVVIKKTARKPKATKTKAARAKAKPTKKKKRRATS